MDPASKFDADPASNWTPDNSWPARRAIRNLGPIGVPAYARMGPSSVHRALEFPEHGGGGVGPSRASGLWNARFGLNGQVCAHSRYRSVRLLISPSTNKA
jgi:hypothetical protein